MLNAHFSATAEIKLALTLRDRRRKKNMKKVWAMRFLYISSSTCYRFELKTEGWKKKNLSSDFLSFDCKIIDEFKWKKWTFFSSVHTFCMEKWWVLKFWFFANSCFFSRKEDFCLVFTWILPIRVGYLSWTNFRSFLIQAKARKNCLLI